MDDEKCVELLYKNDSFSIAMGRFYKFIENAYSYANQTLLQLLLKDEQLISRLRSLKRYFFLSQSSFLTHFLDLSSTELRKISRSASIVKLQSLLDLALNTDVQGEDTLYRDDVKITMTDSGLFDFLLKVVNMQGIGARGEEGADEGSGHHMAEEQKKDKEDKKSMIGESSIFS